MVKKKGNSVWTIFQMKTCFHKSLSSKTAGGGCLHDQNQTSYWLCFEPLSQTNELKQKTDNSLSHCSTFLPFLKHSSFLFQIFVINHCSYLRLTITFSVQAPPPKSLHKAPSWVEPKLLTKAPTEIFDCFQNSTSPNLRTPHYSSLRPFERAHKHICCIIYFIMHRTLILW